uniref:Ubiquinone biosynthesis protein n=1 Tax=Tolypothrix bouteillei VB521301 TaxID=1479485 RepID=A0A0C1RKL5_9CYAN
MTLEHPVDLRPEQAVALKSFIKLAEDPSQTLAVFEMAKSINQTEMYDLGIEYLKSNPDIEALVRERYIAPTPDMDALLQLPQDSLGYCYATHMKRLNFDPNFFPHVEVTDDSSCLELRIKQTHDIWHILTGFGTDEVGEFGLQGFTLAQTHLPVSVAIATAGVFHTLLKYPARLNEVLGVIQRGYAMGVKAKPFLAQKWEEHWEKPLAEWQSELGVKPVFA